MILIFCFPCHLFRLIKHRVWDGCQYDRNVFCWMVVLHSVSKIHILKHC